MMNRIIIIGATGTGKTTLARQLAEKVDLPVTDLDDLHWRPGWIETAPADFRRAEYTRIFADPQKYPNIAHYIRLRTPDETDKFLQEKI